jgi:hypothetical protein
MMRDGSGKGLGSRSLLATRLFPFQEKWVPGRVRGERIEKH